MLVRLVDGEIRGVIDAYVAAWKRGDAEAVLALFAPDAVILPHDGVAPRVGRDALHAFWFPAARGATGIDDFTFTIRDVTTTTETVVAWGLRTLRYWIENNGKRTTYTFDGTFLIVFGKRESSWLITHFMWDDPPPAVA